MNKILIAAAIGGVLSGSAVADVNVYGVVDYSAGYFASRVDGGEKSESVQMDSGRWMGPRVGFKGSEKINEDLTLSFVLETGFDADTGNLGQGGRLFGREAQMSIKGEFGTVSVGRMGNLASGNGTFGLTGKEATPFVAAMGIAGHFNYLYGNNRYDNMLTYRSPTIAGLTFFAQHSLQTNGQETEHVDMNNRYTGLGVTYRNATTYATFIAEHYRYSNDKQNFDNANTYTLAANHQHGAAKFFATLQYFDNLPELGMPKAVDEFGRIVSGNKAGDKFVRRNGQGLTGLSGSVSVAYQICGGTAKASLAYVDVDDDGAEERTEYERTIVGLGYQYPFSKMTGIYVQTNFGMKTKSVVGKADVDTKQYQAFAGMYHRF